jgi:hypothetical protein
MTPLKKLVCILLIGLTSLFIAGKIADKTYQRFWHPFFQKFDVAFKDSTYYDIVYIGNSTVHFGINPYYIDSITRLKSFNLGYGGAHIETMSMLLHGYLEQHPKPKAILLSVDYSTLTPDNDEADPCLFFYYLQNHPVAGYLTAKGYKVGLIKIMPFLKYSYFDDYNRISILYALFQQSHFEKNATIYNGFLSNTFDSIKPNNLKAEKKPLASEKNTTLFYQLLEYCKEENIRVICIIPPKFYISDDDRYSHISSVPNTIIETALAKYHIPHKRYDTKGLFQQDEFSDRWHLNTPGTKKYSIMLGHYIDSCLTYIKQ